MNVATPGRSAAVQLSASDRTLTGSRSARLAGATRSLPRRPSSTSNNPWAERIAISGVGGAIRGRYLGVPDGGLADFGEALPDSTALDGGESVDGAGDIGSSDLGTIESWRVCGETGKLGRSSIGAGSRS